jgi:beta-ureidopropionase / N-carbamoyl-L-amino-acid hydrolase
MPSALRINGERLWSSRMTLAAIGCTQRGGCNRQALPHEDRAARDPFVSWAHSLGCVVSVDEVGNIFAARAGDDVSLLERIGYRGVAPARRRAFHAPVAR